MRKYSINKLYWILLALALYLVALMGCSLEMGKRQCYDVAWTDCVFTVDDLTIASAGIDVNAVVTLSNWDSIEGTVTVDGQERSLTVYASGICDATRSNENVAGNVGVFLSYDESITVRRQDFSLFSGEVNVTATGDGRGTFTLEATVEDIGGEDAPPADDDDQDDDAQEDKPVDADDGVATDDTRDISMTVHASLSHGTSQQCIGGD